jgi:hypothetical protein
MLRSLLLLLLALAAAPSVHAQAATRTDAPGAGGSREAYDPRLALTAETRDPLAPAASAERVVAPRIPRRSYWKVGAIVGGVLGGAVGGAGGLAFDNIEGGSEIGEYTLIGAAGGALAGALLGAGIGALIGM